MGRIEVLLKFCFTRICLSPCMGFDRVFVFGASASMTGTITNRITTDMTSLVLCAAVHASDLRKAPVEMASSTCSRTSGPREPNAP